MHSHRPNVALFVLVALGSTSTACSDRNAAADSTLVASTAAPVAQPETLPNVTAPVGLLEAREAVWRAYFTGDSAQLVALLPEQMVGMGESRAQIIANSMEFARGIARYEGITFADDEFIISDSMAVTFANYEVKFADRGKPSMMTGRAIEVFRLRDGRWINPNWHLHDK